MLLHFQKRNRGRRFLVLNWLVCNQGTRPPAIPRALLLPTSSQALGINYNYTSFIRFTLNINVHPTSADYFSQRNAALSSGHQSPLQTSIGPRSASRAPPLSPSPPSDPHYSSLLPPLSLHALPAALLTLKPADNLQQPRAPTLKYTAVTAVPVNLRALIYRRQGDAQKRDFLLSEVGVLVLS